MKTLLKYQTRDGREFFNEEDAVRHENLLDELDAIESLIPKHPDTSDFANGGGYIQHLPYVVGSAREQWKIVADRELPELRTLDIFDHIIDRYLDDGNSPLRHLYHRLVLCMSDNLCREYGQPYFALHPHKAKDIRVN